MDVHGLILDNGQERKNHGTTEFPCAIYNNEKDVFDVPWHWHEEFEMSFVEAGCGIYDVGQRHYELSAGEGIWMNSGTLHSVPNQYGQGRVKKAMVFHGRIVYGSYDSVLWQKYIRPITACPGLSSVVFHEDVPWQREILGCMRRAYAACRTKPDGYEFEVKQLLVKIFELLYLNNRELLSGESVHSFREADRVKQMLNYIHANYRENITVAQIAACANICQRECLRCFGEMIRMSPIQYLIHYRVNQACRMLRDGSGNITEISNACGFESPSYFSKTFKKLVGCTPREYV